MELQYQQLLPTGFHPASRVWIYQCSRIFSMQEALEIEEVLENFVAQWKSHGTPVKGFATLLFGRFIVMVADETATLVGGCSTDSSVRILKELEQHYKVHLLDRQQLAFWIKDKIEIVPLHQVKYALQHKFLDTKSLYFNNTILTFAELQNKWIVPIEESWLGKNIIPAVK